MIIEIDVLCPDQNESPQEPKAHTEVLHSTIDLRRVTRLQIININGELVDVEN